ncbi:MAG: lyase family protein, partial [Planctomycetota bacterium]
MALWGGRFEGESDPLFRAINDALPIDCRLVQEDIEGSIAWAEALRNAGVLTPDETTRMVGALTEIADLAKAAPQTVHEALDEDVHSWVEAQLIERLGELGKKLHTGRSRNDQVATDLRLWTRRQVSERQAEIRGAQEALLRLAERERDAMLPGYTHLQRAQPVLLAHWCLAYFEMLQRDQERLGDASARLDRCPLGSGALAGTSYPIDREALAGALG